jgi:hypothetical protein
VSAVTGQRIALVLACLVVGWFALPMTALLLDTRVDENLLLPIAALATMGLCGAVGALLRRAAGEQASALRGAVLGAAIGLGCLVVSVVALILLLAG